MVPPILLGMTIYGNYIFFKPFLHEE